MEKCLFCKIAEHEIKSDIVYEDNQIIAFKDINPQAPVHILIIPKKHIKSINDITESDIPVLGNIIKISAKIANEFGCAKTGFRLVVNTGHDAGQAVDHLHFHFLSGRKFIWPPG